ncbi:winged helix-turn-helix domain-containing protein [Kibdelosporangium aridum]
MGEPRHRKLLAILLAHANEVVSAERLVDALWGTKSPGHRGRHRHPC